MSPEEYAWKVLPDGNWPGWQEDIDQDEVRAAIAQAIRDALAEAKPTIQRPTKEDWRKTAERKIRSIMNENPMTDQAAEELSKHAVKLDNHTIVSSTDSFDARGVSHVGDPNMPLTVSITWEDHRRIGELCAIRQCDPELLMRHVIAEALKRELDGEPFNDVMAQVSINVMKVSHRNDQLYVEAADYLIKVLQTANARLLRQIASQDDQPDTIGAKSTCQHSQVDHILNRCVECGKPV